MANTKVTAFGAASAIADADILPVIQSSVQKRTTASALATYMAANASVAEAIRDTIGAALAAGSRITLTVNDAGDSITIQTKEAHPGYVAGRIYACNRITAGNLAVVADRLYLQEWTVHHPITVASIGYRSGTGAVGNVVIGIYASSNGNPGSLLYTCASNPSTNVSNSNVVATFTGATLQPGTYFVGYIFSGTPTISCCSGSFESNYTCGAASGSSYSLTATGLEISTQTYAGGLPSSASAAIVSTGPVPRGSFIVS